MKLAVDQSVYINTRTYGWLPGVVESILNADHDVEYAWVLARAGVPRWDTMPFLGHTGSLDSTTGLIRTPEEHAAIIMAQ